MVLRLVTKLIACHLGNELLAANLRPAETMRIEQQMSLLYPDPLNQEPCGNRLDPNFTKIAGACCG